ncbi:hypothetical protein PanWU01x14_350740 [Parasponia andersonii]|uniref:Uncharacterized protein n=1 Tax=Parasponia andersonii TaxID=3476 RepID=A0A2P5AAV0_PARAD|nr:hypothetical protein PanWU01x14_350740 [Parasponia andersonii]
MIGSTLSPCKYRLKSPCKRIIKSPKNQYNTELHSTKRKILSEEPPLSIQTRLADGSAEKVKFLVGFDNAFVVNSEGRNGGLILCWSNDWNVTVTSYSKGHIDASVQSADGKL